MPQKIEFAHETGALNDINNPKKSPVFEQESTWEIIF